jgi:nitrogen fixation-related uncharacterized protein
MPTARRGALASLVFAWRRAMQWRLMLCWVIALAVPTVITAAPLWGALSGQFDHSVHVADLASGADVSLLFDAAKQFEDGGEPAAIVGAASAVVVSVLLSPWLTGMAVASIRARRRLGMGELLHGGFIEYGRMLRTLLWSALPFGFAVLVGMKLLGHADALADSAILERDLDSARRLALTVMITLAIIAHLTLEAGRGWLGADRDLRSVVRAWAQGVRLVMRRPLAALTVYVGTTAAGLLIAALLAWGRMQVPGTTVAGFVLGIPLTQLAIAMLAWGRIARVYGFADLAAISIAARDAQGPSWPRSGERSESSSR